VSQYTRYPSSFTGAPFLADCAPIAFPVSIAPRGFPQIEGMLPPPAHDLAIARNDTGARQDTTPRSHGALRRASLDKPVSRARFVSRINPAVIYHSAPPLGRFRCH
jgi:hypothetical protein